MSKCSACRKIKLDDNWDKFRLWWLKHLFQEDLHDEKSSSYTQGFVDGLKEGRAIEHEKTEELSKRFQELMNQHDSSGKETGRKA